MPNLYLVSLGCPKNRVDTEVMLADFGRHGYTVVTDPREADVLLVNTCGFIQSAVEEAIDVILEAAAIKKERPTCRLVVTGCLVQRYRETLAAELPEVDLFVGTEGVASVVAQLHRLDRPGRIHLPDRPYLMDRDTGRILSTPPHRAYLKVTEGCDNRCTYCLIPAIRGRQRSRTVDDLVAEAQRLNDGGVKELTLIAQDLTAYGRDLGDGAPNLATLLARLLAETTIPWLRLLYLHPARLDRDLLERIGDHQDRLLPYLDIPLQHVSDPVLRRMGRPYSGAGIAQLISTIRDILPDAWLRTTLMVGFPGETEEDFARLQEAVERYRFDHLGVFTFSDEEGSVANRLDRKVDPGVAERRRDALMAQQAAISADKNRSYVGQEMEVLVEGESEESEFLVEGRHRGQAPEIDGRVYITAGRCTQGDLVRLRITDSHTYDLAGEIVGWEDMKDGG